MAAWVLSSWTVSEPAPAAAGDDATAPAGASRVMAMTATTAKYLFILGS
jgi:hypothetical protein